MSDTSQGPGWWQASDGKWYPPETTPAVAPRPPNTPTQAAVAPETNGGAVTSLVLGIVSLVGGVLCYVGFFVGIAAIIVGSKAKKSVQASGGRQTGSGMATAGIVLGWISIGLATLGLLLLIVIIAI